MKVYKKTKPLLLFDDACPLCTGAADWVSKRGEKDSLLFTPLESEEGRSLLKKHGLDSTNSIVLLEGEVCHLESGAALRIFLHLGYAWPLVAVLRLVPRLLRDRVYRWVARNRYKLTGDKEK